MLEPAGLACRLTGFDFLMDVLEAMYGASSALEHQAKLREELMSLTFALVGDVHGFTHAMVRQVQALEERIKRPLYFGGTLAKLNRRGTVESPGWTWANRSGRIQC